MASTQESEEEVARLRKEVARLRAEADSSEPDPAGRRGWWRPLVAGILVAVAALLAPISVLATWARDEIKDTDRYVETVAPLASDPAIQEAIATKVEDVVFSYLDLDAVTQEVTTALSARDLPPRVVVTLQAIAGPLASAISNFVSDRIEALVESDVFREAWIEANRVAHTQMVAVLTGEGGEALDVAEGAVQVNLAALIGEVKQQLTDQGFAIADRIPEVEATFTIVESQDLASAQWLFALLDDVATWLPFIGLLLIAVAVMAARDRRRMLLAAGLAVAGGMLLLGTILNLARPLYLDAVPAGTLPTDAAAAVYDTLVGFIRLALRAVLVVALIVALTAWLSASSGAGATVRGVIVRGIDGLRTGRSRAGLRTGRFGEVLAEYRTALRVAVVGCVALLYLLRDHPTGATALTFGVIAALLLVLIEVLAAPAPARREVATAQPGAKDEVG